MTSIVTRLENLKRITEIPENPMIPMGDMPGDKALITTNHLEKANCLLPSLKQMLVSTLTSNENERAVISVCGGSGVGKTETSSLIGYMLTKVGIGTYILSGDNYPHRIPKLNDAERLNVFRIEGIYELLARGLYSENVRLDLAELQKKDLDSDKNQIAFHPWLSVYQEGGDSGLRKYLGTDKEINFAELSAIVAAFKNGADELLLKRLGREEGSAWYSRSDMRSVNVLIIEWTHGNNDSLRGVDIPIFLYSTPQETLTHRMARARDKGADSLFVMRVLGIESELLISQAHKAKLILSSNNELLTLDELYELLKAN
ncbi:MAG: adenylylsulfate kinase [Oscillospiraceae bacterium]|nr:adenylylsulfate kinase [Oscillospiraceae bacterium]